MVFKMCLNGLQKASTGLLSRGFSAPRGERKGLIGGPGSCKDFSKPFNSLLKAFEMPFAGLSKTLTGLSKAFLKPFRIFSRPFKGFLKALQSLFKRFVQGL